MNARTLLLISWLLAVVVTPGGAAIVADIYQADVPIASRSDADRDSAMRSALRVVLVKLTGDRGAPQLAALRSVLRRAPDYALQYQYLAAPPSVAGDAAPGLLLRVLFDQRAVDTALEPTGLPFWGRERPATAVWLAVDDGVQRALVGTDDVLGYAAAVRARAEQRGVPVVLPLLDLEDAANLRSDPASMGENVRLASQRYGTDAIVTGAVRSSAAGLWEGTWTLQIGDDTASWTTAGDLPEVVIDEGVDGLADALAARYAQPLASAADAGLDIVVYGVRGSDDYARILAYLGSLDAVTKVFVRAVRDDQVALELTARGGAQSLARTFALGDTLAPVGAGAAIGAWQLLPR
ncbi:MAG: DUF2066 domain-containing protein [Gammaproteobacteria bacterium]|nr:DUF2066 domain-containing protein [Gammaproteobacteria bacterium]